MIKPRLQEAESRRDFDIHVYGSQILDEFGTESPIGSQASFAHIIQKKPKKEVARYFLATLQLVIFELLFILVKILWNHSFGIFKVLSLISFVCFILFFWFLRVL